jgi:hypothetical protein
MPVADLHIKNGNFEIDCLDPLSLCLKSATIERTSRGEIKARMGIVRLIDLQLIYGVESARKKFEDLCARLICSQYPNARTVRNEGGDGGVDVFVGEYTDPAGITVFQIKYFPNGLKKSQKQQVRESFRQCAHNDRFRTKEWILCVPLDLSQDEIAWFAQWSANEASALLPPARMDWWGELKLGHLLLHPANAGIKEEFFPEEHLRRLAEIQQTLTYLVDDLRTRPAQQDLANLVLQQNAMNTWLQYKKDAYVPLHEEFAKIREALEYARNGGGPFPVWIPVLGAERPATFRYTHMGVPVNISPSFTLWPRERHNFNFSGAFSTAFQQHLDELQQCLVVYNSAVEAVRPAIHKALLHALVPALEQAMQDPAYQQWKTTSEDTSTAHQTHAWFEWLGTTYAPPFSAPGEDAVNWWLRPPLLTVGWLLTGNTEQAGLVIHEECKRQFGPNIASATWFQQICAHALAEIQAAPAMFTFQQAQEEAFAHVRELTKSLLNVLIHIRFHQEGYVPPL